VVAVPFLCLLIITIYEGRKNAAIAIREQKAEGVVIRCEPFLDVASRASADLQARHQRLDST
jgi:hypothetical protein